jgi:hypothetical protein
MPTTTNLHLGMVGAMSLNRRLRIGHWTPYSKELASNGSVPYTPPGRLLIAVYVSITPHDYSLSSVSHAKVGRRVLHIACSPSTMTWLLAQRDRTSTMASCVPNVQQWVATFLMPSKASIRCIRSGSSRRDFDCRHITTRTKLRCP